MEAKESGKIIKICTGGLKINRGILHKLSLYCCVGKRKGAQGKLRAGNKDTFIL